MINNPRVLLWYLAQFVLAAGAAGATRMGPVAGLAVFLVASAIGGLTLQAGWSVRQREGALKPVSDGLAAFGMLVFLALVLGGDLVLGLLALLFFAQLAMNVILREYRQLYYGLVIAFVLVLAGAAEALSGTYLLVLALYGLLASFCFADMWLDRHRGPSDRLGQPSAWQRARVAGLVIVVAVGFYLLLPRPPAMNLGSQEASSGASYSSEQWEREADQADAAVQDGAGPDDSTRSENPSANQGDAAPQSQPDPDGDDFAYQGFSETFDIRDTSRPGGGNINAILAYMRAPHGSYLKVRTFDVFDGERWSSSSTRLDKHRVERGGIELEPDLEANYRHTIRLRQDLPAHLPAAPQPVGLWLPATVIATDAWRHPVMPGPLRAGTRYTVDSKLTWFDGRLVGGNNPPRAGDLQVPEGLDPRIAALARQVVSQADSDLQRAQMLEHHLRSEYDYSFESIFDSQGVTPLPRFLFEEKAGHCEYFASAMAVMLRSLGIPARLITGFSVTQKNPMTGYYEIRGLDGHAWVEAWVPEVGWVTFEPTAFYDLPRPDEDVLSAEQIDRYVDRLQQIDEAVGEQDWSMSGLLSGLWQSLASLMVVVFAWLKLFVMTIWPLLAVVFVGVAGALLTRDRWSGPLQRHLARWRIRRYRPRELRPALHFYLGHLQAMAETHGIYRYPGESMQHWITRLCADYGPMPALDALAPMVDAAFYRSAEVSLDEIRQAALAASDQLANGAS